MIAFLRQIVTQGIFQGSTGFSTPLPLKDATGAAEVMVTAGIRSRLLLYVLRDPPQNLSKDLPLCGTADVEGKVLGVCRDEQI